MDDARFGEPYLGVVQETPVRVLVAFVINTLPRAEKAQRKLPGSCGRFSITNWRVLKYRTVFIMIMRNSGRSDSQLNNCERFSVDKERDDI